MKKYRIGYTAGVYDMFHVGHLNVLMNAKALCEHLIVAVSTDEVVEANKHKTPVIRYEDRKRIVEAIRYVDEVVPQTDYQDKLSAAKRYGIDVMFVGDDWKGTEKWNRIEEQLREIGVDVVYLPYTHSISSSMLREILAKQEKRS
ncbi:MAG: adenylyltransferase/cytidyltransferase family protein [Oscillospiraceae bacterium]|jgi:glycerol-3-phosphate cytidylyltransferase|nr:adenylyltransferase/cytidyltransferase family protein [Clostridia bacterium]MBQ6272921.1 adenylyltransferase/cytidyltransferase family protein [Oscillospiraceae bacterium]